MSGSVSVEPDALKRLLEEETTGGDWGVVGNPLAPGYEIHGDFGDRSYVVAQGIAVQGDAKFIALCRNLAYAYLAQRAELERVKEAVEIIRAVAEAEPPLGPQEARIFMQKALGVAHFGVDGWAERHAER